MIQIFLAFFAMLGVPVMANGKSSKWYETAYDLGKNTTPDSAADKTTADTVDTTPVADEVSLTPTTDTATEEPTTSPDEVSLVDLGLVTEDEVAIGAAVGTGSTTTTTTTPDEVQLSDNITQIETETQYSGGSTTDGTSGVTTTTLAQNSLDVISGRVTTLELEGDVTSVRLVSEPDHGHVTINPDNSIALVLSDTDYTGDLSFDYEVTYADGTTDTVEVSVNATEGLQAKGWGLGENTYLLETDDNDDTIVEYGDNHREVYISGSEDALSLADIAAIEGISDPNNIGGKWLEKHPEYGGSEGMALDSEAGMRLWEYITNGPNNEPSSHWLLFESGYEYEDTGRLIFRGTEGESELHPIYIGSYGEGDRPIIHDEVRMYQDHSANIVVQGVAFTDGIQAFYADNFLADDIDVTGNHINVRGVTGFTLRNSEVTDVYKDAPDSGGDVWNQVGDRVSGLYVENANGIVVEGTLFDHNGWAEGYDYYLSADDGQPPSLYSHNVYIQYNNDDVTFRDNISMRGASFGAQIRSGGFIEDNVFLDNNAAVSSFGGNYGGAGYVGNYTLFADNVVTSAGHKTVSAKEGALSLGIGDFGNLSARVDNIVAHLADPNNIEEQAEKTIWHAPVQNSSVAVGPIYDDTVIYNWAAGVQETSDRGGVNIDGLDKSVLNQTTIQNFAAVLLGQDTATIDDLANYLRGQADGALDDVVNADLIIAFFQIGFGMTPDIDIEAETQTFVPNELADGMRWDNRMNWDQGYLPDDGQNVDLNGNTVYYAAAGTNSIENLDFGNGGELITSAGKLTVDGSVTADAMGGLFDIYNAGQVWMDEYDDSDTLTVNVDGGRFANTGHMHGDIEVNATDGQTLLGHGTALFDLNGDSTLNITGDEAQVGFDGVAGDIAALRMEQGSTLTFTTDDTGVSAIEEFRSGTYGAQTSDVLTGVNLGGGTLEVDVSALAASTGSMTLIEADEIIGSFDHVTVTGLSGQNAIVTVDYDADTVMFELLTGTGKVTQNITGTEGDGDSIDTELWDMLTGTFGIYDDSASSPEDEWDYIAA